MFAILTSWIRWNFDQEGLQFTWINSDTLRIRYSVNGQYVTLLTSGIYKHEKSCYSFISKSRPFFKIIELILWFKTPWADSQGKPPGKTKERKPDPRGNYNVQIPRGCPGGMVRLEIDWCITGLFTFVIFTFMDVRYYSAYPSKRHALLYRQITQIFWGLKTLYVSLNPQYTQKSPGGHLNGDVPIF